jgi:hypothetical protein
MRWPSSPKKAAIFCSTRFTTKPSSGSRKNWIGWQVALPFVIAARQTQWDMPLEPSFAAAVTLDLPTTSNAVELSTEH